MVPILQPFVRLIGFSPKKGAMRKFIFVASCVFATVFPYHRALADELSGADFYIYNNTNEYLAVIMVIPYTAIGYAVLTGTIDNFSSEKTAMQYAIKTGDDLTQLAPGKNTKIIMHGSDCRYAIIGTFVDRDGQTRSRKNTDVDLCHVGRFSFEE